MDFRDKSFIDQLLEAGQNEEALKLLNESGELKQPIAEGKNLDALKALSQDLNYKDVVQDELYKTKPNFRLVGEPTETAFSQVADDFGKGKDLIVRQADDIVPSSKPITDLVKLSGNSAGVIDDAILTTGKKVAPGVGKKALGLLGRFLVPGVGMAANAAAALDQPSANEEANQEQALIENPGLLDKAAGAMKAAEDTNKDLDKMFYDFSDSNEQHQFIDDVEKDAQKRDLASITKKSDFVKENIALLNEEISKPGRNEQELQEALDARDSMIKTTMLLEAIAGFIGGGAQYHSGVKGDPINLNLQAMRDLAGEKVKDIDKKRIARLRDIQSDESKEMRNALKAAGIAVPDNLSGETALKMFPQLAALQGREEDRAARKELADLKREEIAATRGAKTSKDNQDFANKLSTQVQSRKSYDKLQTISSAYRNLLTEANKKDGLTDISAMYTFSKAMDPNTGVKEGELDLIKSAGSYGDQVRLGLSNLKNKRLLTSPQREAIMFAVKNRYNESVGQFENDIKPFIKQAENRGIPKEDFLPGLDYYKEMESAKPASSDPKIEEYAKQHGLDYTKAKSILEKRGYVSK